MNLFQNYSAELQQVLAEHDWRDVEQLATDLLAVWQRGARVFLCGNGGSAANAIHLANDLVYGVAPGNGKGVKAEALTANASVTTCLANDLAYEEVFAYQLAVLGSPGDLCIVMSGSGNSPNIIKALQKASQIGMKSYAILGYSGGEAKRLADEAIHFAVDDMQIAEDCQQIVGHMLMRWLKERAAEIEGGRHG